MINGHGDDIHGKAIVSNFSSNICNRLDNSFLDTYLCEHISSIHSYPEPDAASLASIIAAQNNIESDNICVTNGATEAIYLIAHVFQKRKSAILIPTFSEYEDACQINDHQLDFIHSLSEFRGNADLMWLCNPNNPTGITLDLKQLSDFINSYPQTIFVIDQSYEDFTLKKVFGIGEALSYPNVILLHSMTKRYAIPGIRLGYITASYQLISQVKAYCMPWAVNQLAIEAGKYLLNNNFFFNIEEHLVETSYFAKELARINELTVYLEDTNFFLCRLRNRKAKDLKQYLINDYGILIRDAANFRGLDENHFRIATQSREENNNLIKVIEKWI